MDAAEVGKIAGNAVQRRDRDDALRIPYHVVVELRVRSGENDVKIEPVRGRLGEGELRVAVRDDNIFLIYIAHVLKLCVLCDAAHDVEDDKICVAGLDCHMAVVGKGALYELERE